MNCKHQKNGYMVLCPYVEQGKCTNPEQAKKCKKSKVLFPLTMGGEESWTPDAYTELR